ncbi:MAG: ArsR family transcriptional regulator [Clostridia bacterium]|nr:ArsR family transcriptional regulator [Clostridia bacterium]
MSDILTPQKNILLNIDSEKDHELISNICRALSVPERILILKSILLSSKNISTISEELKMPISSVTRHIDVLTEAGLIYTSFQPGPKGHTKYCSQAVLSFTVSLEAMNILNVKEIGYEVEMPLGMFSHCHIKAPCGMTGAEGKIADFDNPKVFFSPARTKAECIWFDSGFISYNFPADFTSKNKYSEITFSFEICSETLYYNNNWPSDITTKINDIEVVTFTSPGDFGGRRGKYTPLYWPVTRTQFGLLKRITVNNKGVFVDNNFVSAAVKFNDLKIYDGNAIKFDVGIKEDAKHRGGINLFGKNFGDFPQSIVMTLK